MHLPWSDGRSRRPRASRLLGALVIAIGGCGGASGVYFPLLDGGDDAATDPGADLGAPALHLTTQASIIVEPDDGVAPFTAAISGAASSISVEMYLLSNGNVINGLIAASKAGRMVKVILEMHPTAGSNANVYSQLMAGGVSVKWASNAYTFTHSKFLIVDGKTLYAMTLNLTGSGVGNNREYAVVDLDPTDVAEAQAVFDADWNQAQTPAVTNLVVAPTTARSKLDKIIGGATARLDIEWEELSDPQIGLRIQDRVRAGIPVSILVPSTVMGTPSQTTLGALKGAGASVKLLDNPQVHAKMVLVDRDRGYVGSVNATQNSIDRNRELGVLWQDAAIAQRIGAAFDADWAAAKAF